MRYVTLSCAVVLFATLACASDLSGLMPETIGTMQRIELLTGDAAQKAVDKLHGKSLPAEASAVAKYVAAGSKERPAEVWISRVSSEKEARRQTGQMVHLMYENPRSPFKNPRRLDINGMAVYRFEGMGQAHLIWFKKDLVYWVSVSAKHESAMTDAFVH